METILYCEAEEKEEEEDPTQLSETGNRLYFFAVCGKGIGDSKDSLQMQSSGHTVMSIADLLNFILPIRKNKDRSFLKLFSRISLGI